MYVLIVMSMFCGLGAWEMGYARLLDHRPRVVEGCLSRAVSLLYVLWLSGGPSTTVAYSRWPDGNAGNIF